VSDQGHQRPVGDEGVDEAGSLLDGGVEGILDELIDIVATAKSVPLSSSVMISRDEALDLLEAARDEFPEELRRARRLLKDREDVLAAARREAGEIVEDGRLQSERMVQRTEIVRQAEYRALRLVEDAEAEARRMRHEAEDYIDQKLAGFEVVLDRTMKTVRHGRERLASVPADPDDAGEGADRGWAGGASEAGSGEGELARSTGTSRSSAGDPAAGLGSGLDSSEDFFDQDSE
jgi:hypothetical protein